MTNVDEVDESEVDAIAGADAGPALRSWARRQLAARKSYERSARYVKRGLARGMKSGDGRLWFEPTGAAYKLLASQELARFEMLRTGAIMAGIRR